MYHEYLDKNNYEIRNDIFEVDEKISKTISLLNKKGYKTTFSCAGHNEQNFVKTIIYKSKMGLKIIEDGKEIPISDKEIEKLKDEPIGVDILEKSDQFIIYSEILGTSTYINFDKDYKFKILPNGFEKTPSWDKKSNNWSKTNHNGICKELSFYNNYNERKSGIEIESEITKNNKDLYEWAKKLPVNH